jgi:hypothetical protein
MIELNKINETIEKYLPVKIKEKNLYGEVFTPINLINEMLDKLPKSIWKNPNLKWLDPANGIGNFFMKVFERLNNGLSSVKGYENYETRKNHIIKNMLYMVELNDVNVDVSKKIFGEEANIYCGSFLDDEWKDYFKINKFDVIVGNPPFNKPQKEKRTGVKGGRTLWDKFVLKSIKLLSHKGYLGFINPASWRCLGQLYKLWNILSKKQILYLKIYGVKDGKNLFNVISRFDLYILQNKENTKQTEVIDELGVKHLLELNKMSFLPNYSYKEINKILTIEEKGVDVIYSRSNYGTDKNNMNNTKTTEYKYPILHSIKQDGNKIIYYSNINKEHFDISKVIIIKGLYAYGYNDFNGEYGMSNYCFGIPIKSKQEGDLILKAMETPTFKKIIAATKWNSGFTNHNMFKYFKKDWFNILLNNID